MPLSYTSRPPTSVRAADSRTSPTSYNRIEKTTNHSGEECAAVTGALPLQPAPATGCFYACNFSVGVDKLHLCWPLAEAAYDALVFAAFKHGRRLDESDPASPYIKIVSRHGYERIDAVDDPAVLTRHATYVVTVQFNPAREATILNTGCGLCPFDFVQHLGRRGFDALQTQFPSACAWEDVQVKRIDLARDFRVDRPADWIEVGRGHRHRHARSQYLYVGNDGVAETLVSGVKGQRSQLYDKSKENRRPLGTDWHARHNLRWETQLVGKKASTSGLGTLELLTLPNLDKAMRKVWVDSRLGDLRLRPSAGSLVAASDLCADEKLTLMGWVTGRQDGLALDIGLSRDSRARLRTMAADLGIKVRGNTVTVTSGLLRLDLASGLAVDA